jgi:hypothetical protein
MYKIPYLGSDLESSASTIAALVFQLHHKIILANCWHGFLEMFGLHMDSGFYSIIDLCEFFYYT